MVLTARGYELVGKGPLGSGGFGVVHCCRSSLDQRLCAVKTIFQPFAEDEAELDCRLWNRSWLPFEYCNPEEIRKLVCIII